MFPALRDDVPKMDDRLRESLCGTLKATGEDADPLVAFWKEEILPIVEAFISRSR